MRARPEVHAAPVGVANRCRCGHYPTHHMRVTPAPSAGGGSFRLDATGPCSVCGEAACRRYAPTL